ncbi:hypothetical protein [Niallia sp. Krafla_26]|uniref:hypothetical protein n=1 Tax=Niallia sp. Krafla_26 TaxID=3064703 RepID=UPI003D16E7A2
MNLREKSTKDVEKPSAVSKKGKTGDFHDIHGTPFKSSWLESLLEIFAVFTCVDKNPTYQKPSINGF